MYKLNLISFEPAPSKLDAEVEEFLDAYLDARWSRRRLPVSALSDVVELPAADIHLFIYSTATLANEEARRITRRIMHLAPGINICLTTGHTDLDNHFIALFHDFSIWPCSASEFATRLYRLQALHRQPDCASHQMLEEFSALNLTGQSPEFLKAMQLIRKMSQCHAAVLIQGETGTGKENAARAIHYLGKRREHSFVPVNCAAIPDELIESELFGHERGAFTDAKQAQAGLVSIANGGTLFLDEVDSLSPKAQAALLRFLQTREYRPLGAKHYLTADVRILAATNADLKSLAHNRMFREDLYFRLNVLNLTMPALRERKDDIPLIAQALLQRFMREYQTPAKLLSTNALRFLMAQDWPGNIRELENNLLRAFLLSTENYLHFDGQIMEQEDGHTNTHAFDQGIYTKREITSQNQTQGKNTNPAGFSHINFQAAKNAAITQFENNYLRELMQVTDGNVSAAARLAGKERRALGKLLQKYAIDKRQYQSASR